MKHSQLSSTITLVALLNLTSHAQDTGPQAEKSASKPVSETSNPPKSPETILKSNATSGDDSKMKSGSPTSVAPANDSATNTGDELGIAPEVIFAKPAPTETSQDPRIIAAYDSTKSIDRTLSVIRERLKEINASYEQRTGASSDLKTVSEEMKPLVKAARVDVSNVLRAAQDLMVELPHTKTGLEAAARLYRQKAITYKGKDLQKITEVLADELERLESDIPRRMRLTSDFILKLTEFHAYLAETERCLNDTSAALQILTAGNDQPKASIEGVAFRIRIKQYMAVLDEYQKKLTEVTVTEPEKDSKDQAPDSTGQLKDGNSAPSKKTTPDDSKKMEDGNRVPIKPVNPNVAEVQKVQDVLQAGTTLNGIYHDPQGLLPLQLIVRKRLGNRISGEISISTRYGLGHQRFTGFVTGADFSLHVTYVSGPLVQTPETWQGRLNTEKIDGVWISNNVEGKFGLNYGPPVVTNR